MQRLITLVLFLSIAGFTNVASANPPDISDVKPPSDDPPSRQTVPDKCTMAPGPGGLAVFPWGEDGNTPVYMGVKLFRSVFIYKQCGMKIPPKVTVPKGSGIECGVQREGHRPDDLYYGYRVICQATDQSKIGPKPFKITIKAELASFELQAYVVHSRFSLVGGKGLSAAQIRSMNRRIKAAKDKADEAATDSGKSKLPNIGFTLGMLWNPNVSIRHGVIPDRDNGVHNFSAGGNFAFYWMFWKHPKHKFLQLGVYFDLSLFNNKLEVEELPPNPDMIAQQWDVLFNLMLRLRPCEWFSTQIYFGFGPSIVSTPDVIVEQNGTTHIVGSVQDNSNTHFTGVFGWAVNIHVKSFIFGTNLKVTWGSEEILVPSVDEDTAERGSPRYFQLIFFAGIEIQ